MRWTKTAVRVCVCDEVEMAEEEVQVEKKGCGECGLE